MNELESTNNKAYGININRKGKNFSWFGQEVSRYVKDSVYFDNHYNFERGFALSKDYNSSLVYQVPLQDIINDEYKKDKSKTYISEENQRYNYNYLYYIREKFGYYNLNNIINDYNQGNCISFANYINYRDYNYNIPKLNNYKERSIFDSNILYFWAPILNLYNIENGRYWICTNGTIWDIKLNKYIPTITDHKGYIIVQLSRNYDTFYCFKMHRLVMMIFCYVDGCEYLEVNHLNGVKSDNRIINLEWATTQENIRHAIENNLFHVNSKNKM